MAQSIADIKKIITDAVLQNETFQALGFTPLQTWESQVSKTNILNLIAYIVAFAIWSQESLRNLHKTEVNEIIAEQRAHGLSWYRNKALDFQFGRDLVDGQDYYDNSGLTDEEIEAEKIVSQCSVDETETGRLIIKVARTVNDELAPLSEADPDQITPFKQYFEHEQDGIKDAGVKIDFVNRNPDYLRLTIDIHYDPLVLDANGQRLDGTNNAPVNDAIDTYLKALPFNGEFSNMALVDALQSVEGVKIPELKSSESKYGANEWQIIDAKIKPDAGYFKIYDGADLTINYIAYNV